MTQSEDTSLTPVVRTADERTTELRSREAELLKQGHSRAVASETAQVEDRMRTQWDAGWGNDLQVLIYGDFDALPSEVHYPLLGIRISPKS